MAAVKRRRVDGDQGTDLPSREDRVQDVTDVPDTTPGATGPQAKTGPTATALPNADHIHPKATRVLDSTVLAEQLAESALRLQLKVPLEDLIKVSPGFAAAMASRFNTAGTMADEVIYVKDPLGSGQEGKELPREFSTNALQVLPYISADNHGRPMLAYIKTSPDQSLTKQILHSNIQGAVKWEVTKVLALPRLPIGLGNKMCAPNFLAMLDSGSMVNTIRKDIAHQLNLVLQPTEAISVGVHSSQIQFRGETTAFVWLGNYCQPVYFFVLPQAKGAEKVILGMPFIWDIRLVFEYFYDLKQIIANLIFNRTRLFLRVGMPTTLAETPN